MCKPRLKTNIKYQVILRKFWEYLAHQPFLKTVKIVRQFDLTQEKLNLESASHTEAYQWKCYRLEIRFKPFSAPTIGPAMSVIGCRFSIYGILKFPEPFCFNEVVNRL
jgi:hypothetical protein